MCPRSMRLASVPILQCLVTTPITTLSYPVFSSSRLIGRSISSLGQVLRAILSVSEAAHLIIIISYEFAGSHRDAQIQEFIRELYGRAPPGKLCIRI